MRLSLILENVELVPAVLKNIDPHRLEVMCSGEYPDVRDKGEDKFKLKCTELAKILMDADPTPRKLYSVGNSFCKPWIVTMLNKGYLKIDGFKNLPDDVPQKHFPEDVASVNEIIRVFGDPGKKAQFKRFFPDVKTDLKDHDLTSASSAARTLLDKIAEKTLKAKVINLNPVVEAGSVKVLDRSPYRIYMFPKLDVASIFSLSAENVIKALQETGMGTDWCTRADYPSGSRAQDHLTKNNIYTLFKGDLAIYQTIVVGSSEQFMDRANTPVKPPPEIAELFKEAMMVGNSIVEFNVPESASFEEKVAYAKKYQANQTENIAGIIKFGGVDAVLNNKVLRRQIIDSIDLARTPDFIKHVAKPILREAASEAEAAIERAGLDFETASLKQTMDILGLSQYYKNEDAAKDETPMKADPSVSEGTREIFTKVFLKPSMFSGLSQHTDNEFLLGDRTMIELYFGLRKDSASRGEGFPVAMSSWVCKSEQYEKLLKIPEVAAFLGRVTGAVWNLLVYYKCTPDILPYITDDVIRELKGATLPSRTGKVSGEEKYPFAMDRLAEVVKKAPKKIQNKAKKWFSTSV